MSKQPSRMSFAFGILFIRQENVQVGFRISIGFWVSGSQHCQSTLIRRKFTILIVGFHSFRGFRAVWIRVDSVCKVQFPENGT